LYLHVTGRRADGYHLLDSLVAFADIGDAVTARPADGFSLTVGGPEAAALDGVGDDNLVLRAARRLAAHYGIGAGAALHLEKRLPVASGIGGGSSDAAAAARALARLWELPLDASVARAVAELGADIPACLAAAPVWVGGIGEELEMAGRLPEAGIVLANPRLPLPTPAVFRTRTGGFALPARFSVPQTAAGLVAALAERRNDLTEAAIGLVPEIAVILDELARLPGAMLSRMCGSGASCFALFADRAGALDAGATLAKVQPGWWTAAGRFLPGQLQAPS
jgi:4-diphosphocytidyl-2-C-methyl-D-erythritol kinase